MFLRLDYYLGKNYLRLILLYTLLALSLLFLINFMTELSDYDSGNRNYYAIIMVVLLDLPQSFEVFSPIIILLAAFSFLNKYSSNQELTAVRTSGYSSWRILRILVLVSGLCGLLMMLAFTTFAEFSYRHKNIVQLYYGLHGKSNLIWIKQPNPEKKNGYLLLGARLADLKTSQLQEVKILFFNAHHEVYKKYNAKSLFLEDYRWTLYDVHASYYKRIRPSPFAFDDVSTTPLPTDRNTFFPELMMPVQSRLEHVHHELDRVSQPVENMSFWHLRRVIASSQKWDINSRPFVVRYHVLLRIPLFFIVLMLIPYTLLLNNNDRSGKALYLFLESIFIAFCLYFLLEFLRALALNDQLNTVVATWFPLVLASLLSLLCINEMQL